MTSRAERDLKKAREERKTHARAREDDQDSLRDRERQRAEERARDEESYRDRERRRQAESERRRREYETRYGSASRTRPREHSEMGRELERLAYAVARSNTRLLVGATEVIGNLLVNLNDSLWGRPLGDLRCGTEERAGSTRARRAPRYPDPYDDDPEAEAFRARRDERSYARRASRDEPYYEPPRRGYRERTQVENVVSRSADVLSDLSDDLTQALRDSAAVLSRSAQDIACILEDAAEPDDEYEYDEPEPAEEVAENAAGEEAWKAEERARDEARDSTSTDKPIV